MISHLWNILIFAPHLLCCCLYSNFFTCILMIWRCACTFGFLFRPFFSRVVTLADSNFVPATPSTSFMELTGNCAECFIMIWRCECDFVFSVVLFLRSYGPLSFLAFSNFLTIWPRELHFDILLLVCYGQSLDVLGILLGAKVSDIWWTLGFIPLIYFT